MAHALHTLINSHRPRWRTRRTTLGEDLDHATCSLSPIKGRSSRALNDLNTIDIVRVDAVDGHRPCGTFIRRHQSVVLHTDTVHIDQRAVALRNRAVTANPDLRPGTDLTIRAGNRNTGCTALKNIRDVGDRSDRNVAGGDRLNGVTHLTTTGLTGSTGHNHAFKS